MSNDKKKDNDTVFSLSEPQIKAIFEAIESEVSNLADQLRVKELLKEDGYEDSMMETMQQRLDILSPLYEFWKQLYFLVEGSPEAEPVLRCEVLVSKAMEENYEEERKRRKKDMELSTKYKN